ncbi:DUF2867 domain-containing protein [Bradyrhizobium guangxiense]|jgi:hypothetical protein
MIGGPRHPNEICALLDCCDAERLDVNKRHGGKIVAAPTALRSSQHPVSLRMTRAHAVPMPDNSVLAPLYAGADLLDAFAIQLPAGASDDVEVLARAALERQAWWIRALTRVRDVVMATVAVKSSRAVGLAAAARGPVIGFFPVLSKSATELILGADDWHLDFRVTIQLRANAANGRELVAGTVVHCHNWLGRIYLKTIAPFHRVIVPASLEQAARAVN